MNVSSSVCGVLGYSKGCCLNRLLATIIVICLCFLLLSSLWPTAIMKVNVFGGKECVYLEVLGKYAAECPSGGWLWIDRIIPESETRFLGP